MINRHRVIIGAEVTFQTPPVCVLKSRATCCLFCSVLIPTYLSSDGCIVIYCSGDIWEGHSGK